VPLPLIVKKHGGGLLLGDVLPHLRWGTIEPGGVSFAAPIRSVQRSGRRGVSELLDGGGDPAPGVRAGVIAVDMVSIWEGYKKKSGFGRGKTT